MKRLVTSIIVILLCIFTFFPVLIYAGREAPCDHDRYEVYYSSGKQILKISCEQCGECHRYTVDSKLVDSMIMSLWNE